MFLNGRRKRMSDRKSSGMNTFSDSSSNNSDSNSKDLDDSPVVGPTTRRAWNDWCSKGPLKGGTASRSSGDENDDNIVTTRSAISNAEAESHTKKECEVSDPPPVEQSNKVVSRRTTQRRAAANRPPIIDDPDPPMAVSIFYIV